MQNIKKNGIFCDLCTNEVTDKFVYYSVNFKEVDCDKNRPVNLIIENVMDLDICETCYNKMKIKVRSSIKIINSIKENKNAKR